MNCPNCGAENPATSKFCVACGTPLVEGATPAKRFDLPEGEVTASGTSAAGLPYKLIGTTLQAVVLELQQGQVVYGEAGGMSWMSGNVEMKATSGGGLGKVLGRLFAGESLFVVDYNCISGTGLVGFANEFPGKIIPLELAPQQQIIVQRDAFMCAEKSVSMELHFQKKLGAGFFGGEGFFLQRLTGPGMAFIELDGEIIEYTLESGQILKVDPGHVAMFEPTVDFDVEIIHDIKTIFFGGEGLFLGRLRGPGRVWLQTMPMMNLVKTVARYLPKQSSSSGSGFQINLGG
ncbi:MAG: TIGR00266 family protein [Chloroflexia bacterium]|nr:TIGR00266 family protein [Chloroflexia bacterium]